MAGYGYDGYWDTDDYGRRVFVEGRRSSRQTRYRPPPQPLPPGGWEDEEFTEEIRRVRSAPRRQQATPQQQPTINIFNDNQIDDRDNYEPPPPRRRPQERVYHDTQIVQIDSSRDRDRDERSYRTRRDIEELERLKREKEKEDLEKEWKQKQALKAAKEKQEEDDRKEREKKLKEKAVEEWKEKQEKEKREKEEKEKEKKAIGQEYMRQQLRKDGYTEEEIEVMMSEKEKKKRGPSPSVSSTSIVIANRPTYLKVHRKHIDPQTLDAFGLEWDWADDEYISIHRWIPESEREILFEHTRKLKERKLIQFAEVETVEVKNVRKDRNGRLLMVRKKEDRSRSKSPGVTKTKKFFLG